MNADWRRALHRNVQQMTPDDAKRLYESLARERSICGPAADEVRQRLTGGLYSQSLSADVYRALGARAGQGSVETGDPDSGAGTSPKRQAMGTRREP